MTSALGLKRSCHGNGSAIFEESTGEPLFQEFYADTYLGGICHPLWVDRGDGSFRVMIWEHPHQRPCLQTGLHVPRRSQDDAVTVQRPLVHHLPVEASGPMIFLQGLMLFLQGLVLPLRTSFHCF